MIVGLLLAAGGARRFGSQKLVAPLNGVPIVRRAAETLASATGCPIVVIGNEGDRVRSTLDGLALQVIENANWETGMASSLVCGIRAAPTEASAIIVALGDQPGVDASVIQQVVDTWRATGKPIVITQYEDGRGHPVLFARSMFDELMQLSGDAGARTLIERSMDRVAVVRVNAPAPADVDTPEDLRTWTV